jgi:hypothetical protein
VHLGGCGPDERRNPGLRKPTGRSRVPGQQVMDREHPTEWEGQGLEDRGRLGAGVPGK